MGDLDPTPHLPFLATPIASSVITLTLMIAVAFALYLILIRGNEIFFVSIREGRALLVRGRIPPSLLSEFGDVARRTKVKRGSIQAYRGEARARLVCSGIDEGDAQRLRNVFSLHSIQALRAAKYTKPENLGQLLGIAWLAWFLVGRR
jgi:Protein of unknown function (DUF3634)